MPTPPAPALTCLALVLLGADPAPFRPDVGPDGSLDLPAARARLVGERLALVADPGYIGGWSERSDRVSWEFVAPKAGDYLVVVEYAAPVRKGGSVYEVELGGQVRQGYVHATGSATTFLPQPLMTAVALKAGRNRLEARAVEVPHGLVMNLRRIRLVPDVAGAR